MPRQDDAADWKFTASPFCEIPPLDPQSKDACMFRLGSLSLFGLTLIAFIVTAADDPDIRISKALSVQTAMHRARVLLVDKNAKLAVELLEEQLPKVNGNTEYLVLLRDAYRAYVKDLQLAGQPALARRYLDRLCILDPNAANELGPQAEAPPRKFEPDPAVQAKPRSAWPNFTNPIPSLFGKKEDSEAARYRTRGDPGTRG